MLLRMRYNGTLHCQVPRREPLTKLVNGLASFDPLKMVLDLNIACDCYWKLINRNPKRHKSISSFEKRNIVI
jgi:hypothetical protein